MRRFPGKRYYLSLTLSLFLISGCVNDDPGPGQTAPPIAATEPGEEPETTASFYTVDHYDLEADPAEQLAATLERAQAEKKRVLLQVGGDWCGWCKKMTRYMAETDSVRQRLTEHFLVQKVTYDSRNKNEAFLSKYPEVSGYPHLFVLSAAGELLHSQDTAELEFESGYSEDAVVAFLDQWSTGQAEAEGGE